jgi:hypothetical protein
MSEVLVILGFILILLAFLFSLPFVGVGTLIPFLGDFIDVPLSFLLGIAGIALVITGGVLWFITDHIILFITGLGAWLSFLLYKHNTG